MPLVQLMYSYVQIITLPAMVQLLHPLYKHTQPTISPVTRTLEMTVLLSSPLDNLTIINLLDIKFCFFSQMLLICYCVTPGCTQCLGNIFSTSKQYPFALLLFTAHASCAFPIDARAQMSDE